MRYHWQTVFSRDPWIIELTISSDFKSSAEPIETMIRAKSEGVVSFPRIRENLHSIPYVNTSWPPLHLQRGIVSPHLHVCNTEYWSSWLLNILSLNIVKSVHSSYLLWVHSSKTEAENLSDTELHRCPTQLTWIIPLCNIPAKLCIAWLSTLRMLIHK